jgi:membrane glycosyltransferase
MIGPVMMVAQSCFMFGLLFGYRIVWDAQQREDGIVPLREAVGGLWPQFLLGLAFGLAIWHVAPGALLWAIPTLAGSLLAIPFACVTANPLLGAWMRRVGLCAVPGE